METQRDNVSDSVPALLPTESEQGFLRFTRQSESVPQPQRPAAGASVQHCTARISANAVTVHLHGRLTAVI